MIRFALPLFALYFASCACADEPKVKKLLLIGIDGCRTDALLAARAPNLHRLADSGAISKVNDVLGRPKSGADTVTLAGWTTMLTGVWPDKHGVLDNGFQGSARQATFFSRIRNARPGAATAAFLSFRSLIDHVFERGDDARFVNDGSKNGFGVADEEVTEAAVKFLAEKDPTATFVYFAQVDSMGHRHGFHPKCEEYVQAIAAVDRHVGKVLKTIAARPTYANEDWLTIVGADHGGHGLGHTGGASRDDVRFTFLILNGPSVDKAKMPAKTGNVDVATTALTHLGIEISEDWRLDGACVGLKR